MVDDVIARRHRSKHAVQMFRLLRKLYRFNRIHETPYRATQRAGDEIESNHYIRWRFEVQIKITNNQGIYSDCFGSAICGNSQRQVGGTGGFDSPSHRHSPLVVASPSLVNDEAIRSPIALLWTFVDRPTAF